MKRDLVDELYKTAYKRYREKYPNKNFVSIPNFLDSLWYRIEGELNRNGYNAAKKYVEEAELIVLKLDWMVIHECDDEEKPMQWAAEIHHPEYGKWCWISNTGDHFIVEVENCGGFLELAKCKSLISAKRWVAINLIKR